MKIAIKGNGNDVVGDTILGILENLGGKDRYRFFGNGHSYYFIDEHGYIKHDDVIRPNYTYYESLEDYLNPKNQIINYLDI